MLLPRPTSTTAGTGTFVLDVRTTLTADRETEGVACWVRGALGPPTGAALLPPGAIQRADPEATAIVLALDDTLPAEGFRLTVTEERVRIEGGDAAGAFYGAQALRQLLPPAIFRRALVTGQRWEVAACTVEDAPRFGWRGVMLDVARHFVPTADLLRFVDLAAMHRLNVLHLHLTDDQGWRVEIRRYPRLTEVGGWRRESQVGAVPDRFDGRPHGGFYTQEDLREIVAYAAERHVTVVPEIDVPGHSQAAIAAYPQLGVTDLPGRAGEPLEVATTWGIIEHVLDPSDATLAFYRDVLDEVLDVFPSRYVGVGGDECPKREWRESPRVQAQLRELGLADEEALQSWFVHRLDEHLTSRGRRLFGWDEILEGGLAPGATVASWRGMAGAVTAARAGHDVVACPEDPCYLDSRQSDRPDEPIPVSVVTTVEDLLAFEPVPPELTEAQARHVLGAQCNVWTEYMDSARVIDYQVFPRLAAFAEAVWSSGPRDPVEFLARLDAHLPRLGAVGVEYRRASGPLPWQTRPGVPGRPATRDELAAHVADLTAGITT